MYHALVMMLNIIFLAVFLFTEPVYSSILSVSSIKACINDGSGELLKQLKTGEPCQKKLVVSMTVQANEGKAQYIEVNINRVHDSTENANVELKTPVRIRVSKSPVLINYQLYQLGYVNSNPYEEVVRQKGRRCRADWYSKQSEAACGFQRDDDNNRIFDSQGFCCRCRLGSKSYDRGESKDCLGRKRTAHCLRFNPLYMYVFGLYPPQLKFSINVTIEQANIKYKTVEYEMIETLTLGPSKRISNSKDFSLRAEYIADFNPSTFMPVLAHKNFLVPNIVGFNVSSPDKDFVRFATNISEWMLVDKQLFDFTGFHCDTIGVSYTAFRNQADRCSRRYGTCLRSQPYPLWLSDEKRKAANQKLLYQLHSFGKVHSMPHSEGKTDFQLNFIADKIQKSLITLSMEADSLKFVLNKSPGRIIEAYIEPFEALSVDGYLNVYVQNTGSISASYTVSVSHCSGGVDWIPSKTITIDPLQQVNVSFTVRSYHSIGQINSCDIQLLDQTAEVLDNLTINFRTLDTCFCYGYCGCSCGNNVTECPPRPTYQSPDTFKSLSFNFEEPQLQFLRRFALYFAGVFGTLYITGIVIACLVLLGALKVLVMFQSGELTFPLTPHMAVFLGIQIGGMFVGGCAECCGQCCHKLLYLLTCGYGCAGGSIDDDEVSSGATQGGRPVACDGTCSGAKKARREYRKMLRKMKRKGEDTSKMPPWWKYQKYTCTHVIRNTSSMFEVCKGLFFFIYCPLLPLWWMVELAIEWIQKRRKRARRKREYRAKKEERRKKKDNTYLLLDKYTRGEKEKKLIDFKEEKKKAQKKHKNMEEIEEGLLVSNEELGLDSDDTTATDEAADLDELIDPGYPVYMNYAQVTSSRTPKSLKSPGKSFSIKGKLTRSGNTYMFDLHKYTDQVLYQKGDKGIKLKPKNKLSPSDFKQTLQPNVVPLVITLTPLFTCLNK